MIPSNLIALLPEYLLTLAGIAVMMIEAVLKPGTSRKPLGYLALLGTLAAGAASWYQRGAALAAGGSLHAFSNTIQADPFSIFFHLLIAAVVFVTLLSSLDYFDTHEQHSGEYFALVLFGAVGMMLMTCSTELLMVFIGLEISSISTYIMAGMRKSRITAAESSIKYFLLGSFATAFFLYGVALAYGATGSTSIPAIAAGLAATAAPRMAFLAIAMIVIGLGFKVSAAPFHVWTPDVYQGAPAPVVGLMSTAPKAAAFAVLLRVLYSGFPTYQHRWSILIAVLAVLSMCIGNLGALFQTDVKRMLAYSSIAHAGYLLVAFTAFPFNGTQPGIAAACFYSAAYAAMNVGAFAVLTAVSGYSERTGSIRDYAGLASERPVLAAALSFFLLSLIGIPFTGGFFGKFYVFSAALHSGHVGLALIGLLNSGIACFYYLRLIAAIYTRPEHDKPRFTHRSYAVPTAVAISLAAIATLGLGVLPGHLLNMANSAAAQIPSTAPLAPAAPTNAETPANSVPTRMTYCSQHPKNCPVHIDYDTR